MPSCIGLNCHFKCYSATRLVSFHTHMLCRTFYLRIKIYEEKCDRNRHLSRKPNINVLTFLNQIVNFIAIYFIKDSKNVNANKRF